jgi:hypothetical protein
MNKNKIWLIIAIIAVVGFVFVSCGPEEEEVPVWEGIYGTWYDDVEGDEVEFTASLFTYKCLNDAGTQLVPAYRIQISEFVPTDKSYVGYDVFGVVGALTYRNDTLSFIEGILPLNDKKEPAKVNDACFDIWGISKEGDSITLFDDDMVPFLYFNKTKSSSNININASLRSARR